DGLRRRRLLARGLLLGGRLLGSGLLGSRPLGSRPLGSRLLGSRLLGSRLLGSGLLGSRLLGSRLLGGGLLGSARGVLGRPGVLGLRLALRRDRRHRAGGERHLLGANELDEVLHVGVLRLDRRRDREVLLR